MKHYKKIFVFFIVLLLTILLLPFSFLLDKKLAYYAYKEITYDLLITHLRNKENNSEKICLSVLDFLHDNLFTPPNAGVIDKDVYNDLIRGVAWCDQRAWALGTLVGRLGIENRMPMTRNPEGVSNHTVSEILINKKWRFFDPFWGIVVYDNGELTSYEDICNNPSLFYMHPKMMKLKYIDEYSYKKIKEFYTTNIFYNNPTKPTIWGNPAKKNDLKRWLVNKILGIDKFILQERFSFLFQDIYLNYVIDSKEQNLLYIKARNYDLYMRYGLAVYYYDKFIDTDSKNADIENALFFYGVLLNKNKSYYSSIDTLQLLLEKYPASKWKAIAYYYLGYNYELLEDNSAAKKFYWQVIDTYKTYPGYIDFGIPAYETDVIERLYNLVFKS